MRSAYVDDSKALPIHGFELVVLAIVQMSGEKISEGKPLLALCTRVCNVGS